MKKSFTPLENPVPLERKRIFLTGFTLIELMVAVCVLSIGIVGVARSLLVAISALDYSQNVVNNIGFLDNVMCELKVKIREKEGLQIEDEELRGFLEEKRQEATDRNIGRLDWANNAINKYITELELRLRWQEANREKDVALATILPLPEK